MTNARLSPLDLALSHINRGWNPVAVSRKTKKPIGKEWQKHIITAKTAARYFNGADINVGVQLGPNSHNLTDVDLDCPEAVRIGGFMLPETKASFGRKSKPRSHCLYYTDLAEHIDKACLQFRDVDSKDKKPGTMLLELRIGGGGKGAQSVFPGSLHPSGEEIEWDEHGGGDPNKFDGEELLKSVRRTAAVVLLARHWPIEGARHKAALVIGGFLARASFSADEVSWIVTGAAKAALDPEWADRAKAARDQANNFEKAGSGYGTPALIEAFGSDVVRKIVEWLEIRSRPARDPPPTQPTQPTQAARTTLTEVHAVFQKWLGDDYDVDAIDFTCAAGACARLTGDPLWPLIISGPGAAKTETVQSLSGAGAQVTSTIASEGALLSATSDKSKSKGATGGLLRLLGPGGVLVIKDITSILSADRNTRGPVLGAIREIYDVKFERNVGVDGGRTLTWEGRIVIVGACTTAWDAAHSVISIMGDRFVILRIDSTRGRRNSGLRAIRNTGDEVRMRKELAKVVGGLIAHASLKETRLSEKETEKLVNAADIVTLARTGVEYDHKGDVASAHAPEMPTRFAKQLSQIIRGGVAIGLSRQQGMQLAIRCARDSIPPLRLEIMLDVANNPDSKAGEIHKRVKKPFRTVKRAIDTLVMLGVLVIEVKTKTTYVTNPDGISEPRTSTYEVYNINPNFDADTLDQIAAAASGQVAAEM